MNQREIDIRYCEGVIESRGETGSEYSDEGMGF